MDKQTPRWALFSMGLSISAVQGLLIRLLLVGFSGNELAIGLILGNLMLAEAMGSYLGGRLACRLSDIHTSFLLLQVLFALLLPVAVTGGYLVRQLVAAVPGQALDLVTMAWASLIVLFPLSCIHGAMFSLGTATLAGKVDSEPRTMGQLYALEALGAMCGGVILTFLLIPRQQPIQSALLVAILGFVSAGCLARPRIRLLRQQGLMVLAASACAVCLLLLLTSQASNLHRSLVTTRWGGAYDVVYERDSPYGNIAVTRLLGQYTVLANGVPHLTAPFPDIIAVEEVVHLPLLFHPDPRRVLLIGAGLGGVSSELLKYPVECIDYAELDPALIEAVRALPTELTRSELPNERLQVHGIDGRLWLHRFALSMNSQRPYDIVLVNLPYPATLEINRFYTQEFLQLVQVVVDNRGLAVFKLPGSLTYVGPGQRALNASLMQGLQASFTHVRPIPGEIALWLASPSLPLAEVPVDQLVATWQQRTPPTHFLTEEYLRLKLDLQRLNWFEAALSRQQELPPNRDLRPSGVLFGLAYWSEMFAPATSRLLTAASSAELWQWCLVPIVLSIAIGIAVRTAHGSV